MTDKWINETAGPLANLKVLDLGHALAGPFAATLLADLGAQVIKVEKPGTGDPMRRLGPRIGNRPVWWSAAARNKVSVTLDFSRSEDLEILLDLISEADVLVENFRPGVLEKHGLGWEQLHTNYPRLVMLRISGFGQSGPSSQRPGFGRLADAMSGAAYLTGEPDGPPVSPGFSMADTLAGTFGALGVLAALHGREETGHGDCIDLALYEPLLRLIDWQLPVSQLLDLIPVRAGGKFPTVLTGVDSDYVKTRDDRWLVYSAATDPVRRRLRKLVLRQSGTLEPDLTSSLRNWVSKVTIEDALNAFIEGDVPAASVFHSRDILSDPHYRARESVIDVHDKNFGMVSMHGVIPKLLENPGHIWATGPELGDFNETIKDRGVK